MNNFCLCLGKKMTAKNFTSSKRNQIPACIHQREIISFPLKHKLQEVWGVELLFLLDGLFWVFPICCGFPLLSSCLLLLFPNSFLLLAVNYQTMKCNPVLPTADFIVWQTKSILLCLSIILSQLVQAAMMLQS